MADNIKLALDADQMFQKAIAAAAKDQHELRFEAMDRAYIGFVTGLDKDWVRITETDSGVTTDRLRRILIQRPSIISLAETGRTIADLSSAEATQVKSYSGVFRKAARGELGEAS